MTFQDALNTVKTTKDLDKFISDELIYKKYSVDEFRQIIRIIKERLKLRTIGWAGYFYYRPSYLFLAALLKENLLQHYEIKYIYLFLIGDEYNLFHIDQASPGERVSLNKDNIMKCLDLVKYVIPEISENELLDQIISLEEPVSNKIRFFNNLLKYPEYGIDYTKMPRVVEELIELCFSYKNVPKLKVPKDKQKAFIDVNPMSYIYIEDLSEEFTGLEELGNLGL